MLAAQSPKTFASWYLSNLLGWIVGFLWIVGFFWGIDLNGFHLYPFAERSLFPYIIYYIGPILEPLFMFLPPIVCVAVAQWLKFRQWKVKFDVYQWIAANVKGTFIALVFLLIIGSFVGAFQQNILDFLYHDHTYSAQTDLILKLISLTLPLLGSIGTSAMIAIDIFKWKFGKGNATTK